MRWTPTVTRSAIAASLFLSYPWAVVALQRVVPGPAMMLGVVPVAATAALLGTRLGLLAAAAALCVDGVIAHSLKVIALDLLPWALLTSLCAYLVLVFSIGALRRLLQRVSKTNQALAEANQALAAEAALRTKMATELEANASLHASLLNSMVEGVGLFDHEDRFVFANAAAERIFGAAPGQLVGQSLASLVEPERLKAPALARRDPSLDCITYKLTTRGVDAERRQLAVTEKLLDRALATTAVVLRVLHDVTASERLEQEQRELASQMQRAQAMQSLGVLAGGVAHDFNNILTGVLGHAELALLRLERASRADLRSSLCEIRDFSREAATLARQMLAYAGKGTLATEVLSLEDVATEALHLVHSTVAARAHLEREASTALPNVKGDRTQLRQVIVNLVINAVESMGDRRGTVRLAINAQQLEPAQLGGFWKPERPEPGPYVVLTVSDNGQGMSEATLARVFEPFFSTKLAGRGMGLAATQGIVVAHGGAIGVESREGVGSTFRILLPPKGELRSVPASATLPIAPARGQGTILLIDDERAVRTTAAQLLEELGYEVRLASAGREALEQLASAAVRLVLLDMTMPDMDGRETLNAIRRAGHAVPVVFISGYHQGGIAPLLKEPGVVGFLQKPLQLDQLARCVREALRDGSVAVS